MTLKPRTDEEIIRAYAEDKRAEEEFRDLISQGKKYYEYLHGEESMKDLRQHLKRVLPQIDVMKDGYLFHIVVTEVNKERSQT